MMNNIFRATCLIALSVLTGCDGGGALSVPRVLGPKTPTCDDPEALKLTARVIQQNSGQRDPLFGLPVNLIAGHSLLDSEMILVRGIDKEIGKASCVASFVFLNQENEVTTRTCKYTSRTEFELQHDTTGQLVSTIKMVGPISCVKLTEDEVRSLNENPTDPISQARLGDKFRLGEGVPKNDAEAVKWFRKAADQGVADAQTRLGWMYAKGEGVPKNDAEAVKWYRLAVDQGFAGAQYNLGVMYAKGEGVSENDAEAVKWFRKAADQGLADAQYNLGVMYADGRGVPKNDAEAVMWFRKAADQGVADAQTRLGYMYQYGKGVTQDLKLAVFWFQQVANQGNVQAQYNLGELYYAGDEFGGVADESRATVQWTQLLKSADKASQLFKLAQAGLSCIDRGVPSKSCAPLRCSIEGRSDCPDL